MALANGKVDEFDEGTVVQKKYGPSDYRYGEPVFKGEATPCFDDGLLFRIVEKSNNNRWSFYNDTTNTQMKVQFVFGKNSALRVLENTEMEQLPDGSYRATVMVYPMETELFVEGETNGFTSNIRALPLSEEYLKDMARQDYEFVKQETATLFNSVDEKASTDEMVKVCVKNNIKFVDFAFPPEQKSLQIGSLMKLKVLPWERPSMFLSDENAKQARLFRNGVHPSNLDEGDLGDSWLTGAMAALAEFPDKIRDIFRHPESVEQGQNERACGIYRVTLNKNGWWTNVIVDDYLPVAGGRPKFARSKGDSAELWPAILEKAYAKVFGGYGFIVAGDPLHALQDMSGFPCSSFDNAFVESTINETYELFMHLKNYSDAGYQIVFTTPTREAIMTARGAASCGSPSQAERAFDKANLLLGHTYSVIRVGYFEEHDLRLLQLRNPWSQTTSDWNGPWNKRDANWDKYTEVAEYFNFQNTDDGTFFMEWPDVQDYFVGCGVCFIQHPMYDYRVRGTFFQNVPTTCLEISVARPTVINLILSQDDKRGTDKPENAPIMISVAHGMGAMSPMRVDMNSGFDNDHPSPEYTFLQSRDVSMFYEFTPENSPYLVVPRAMSQFAKLPYTLGILCPHEVGKENSEVRIAFRALAPENRIFDNFQKFNCETVATETEFQGKGIKQFFPDIYVGTIIQTSDD
ncbi:putative calpain-like cysteine peptidase putativecysteine peptidase Clan CA family C2 [Leptomonas pyrrhocoris]|uniref:Putative calpain-like cysteine peptidase putativecysteine peptidase Clan CA family C2 n=1 Tax=Leptomonas pyrrhocoris TaxID=157538 RepID=A0A0N1J4D1_LEPPY|nr:putative calpain-like cysteine peptidase putativecysteine peptidase Clan CA family C2 [Leptomonas pyrrhocoris]KPA75258.1 putative calpain-like cysteine peptidase putativecysteine peptidase Clan CA family C2 [Leptomonas pyrrhocoris]|eukprot:XP_015653697.1 putative calpain-like cysteine peptidase putativecysteine peptidase Clan CA family C2 [Leptomonas pyrrhocoris]